MAINNEMVDTKKLIVLYLNILYSAVFLSVFDMEVKSEYWGKINMFGCRMEHYI